MSEKVSIMLHLETFLKMNISFDVDKQNLKLGMKVSQTMAGADQRLLWTMKFYKQ